MQIKKRIFIGFLLAVSISLTGCMKFKVEKGMKYFGKVPEMHIGIQTNETEYPIDNIKLDIYYGWHKHCFLEQQGYENIGVFILAHESSLSGDKILGYEFDNYRDIENIGIENFNIATHSDYETKYHILKIITENLNDEKYIVELSKSGKAEYKTRETFLIPLSVIQNPRVGFNITISKVAKNLDTGKYKYIYIKSISLNYDILENGNINLIE